MKLPLYRGFHQLALHGVNLFVINVWWLDIVVYFDESMQHISMRGRISLFKYKNVNGSLIRQIANLACDGYISGKFMQIPTVLKIYVLLNFTRSI